MKEQICFDCGTKFENKTWLDYCPNCKSKHIIHTPIEFDNLGDINYLAYGGNLVFKHFTEEESPELSPYCFNVFQLYTPFDIGEGDNRYMAMLYYVDVRDYEDKKEDILYPSGNEDMMSTPYLDLFGSKEILASEIVSCGLVDDCITYHGHILDVEDAKLTYEELIQWLCNLGIYIE